MNRPDHFFVIGAQKAGTTSLYRYLATHPDIFPSPVKENKFFLMAAPTEAQEREYEDLFRDRAGERWVFDATPHYTQYPRYGDVVDRIYAKFPTARFVYIVRHPIERIYSHYLYKVSSPRGRERRTFEDAIQSDAIYLNTSRYYYQVGQFLKRFTKSRILVVLFEDLASEPQAVLKRVFEFLEVDASFQPANLDVAYNPTRGRTKPATALLRLKSAPFFDRLPWRTRLWLFERFRATAPTRDEIFTPASYNRLHELLQEDVADLSRFLTRELPWDFPTSRFR